MHLRTISSTKTVLRTNADVPPHLPSTLLNMSLFMVCSTTVSGLFHVSLFGIKGVAIMQPERCRQVQRVLWQETPKRRLPATKGVPRINKKKNRYLRDYNLKMYQGEEQTF